MKKTKITPFYYITTDMQNVAFPGTVHEFLINKEHDHENANRLNLIKNLQGLNLEDKLENLVILYRAGDFENFPEAKNNLSEYQIGKDNQDLDIYKNGIYVKIIQVVEQDSDYLLIYKVIAPFEVSKFNNDPKELTNELIAKIVQNKKIDADDNKIISTQQVYGEIEFFDENEYDFLDKKDNKDKKTFSDLLKTVFEKNSTNKGEITSFLLQSIPSKNKKITTWNDIEEFIKKYNDYYFADPKKHQLARELTFLNFANKIILQDILKYKFLFEFSSESYDELMEQIHYYLATLFESESKINRKISLKLNEQQDDFMLRERYKTLKELVDKEQSLDEYQKTIKNNKLSNRYPIWIQNSIQKEGDRIAEMMSSSPEVNIVKTYIDLMKKLPWRLTQKEKLDIKTVQETLEKYHYGLEEVKERIIEHIAVLIKGKRVLSKSESKRISVDKKTEIDMNLFKDSENELKSFNNVPILTLIGPPGTGKTSLTKAIAEALGRKIIKVSLGGVRDEAEIRGHRKTYVGAMPGKIIKAILKAKVSNPVILLDEIDKMSSDSIKGDPASAMLEVLDPEQNTKFQDHYLEHEYDLSKVIFIATANYYEGIPEALLDRVELIEVHAYTLTEKLKIARKHLIPKVIEQSYINENLFKLSEENLEYLITHYTRESGVRNLKKVLDKIARKISMKTEFDQSIKEFEITKEILTDFLGPIIFNTKKHVQTYTAGVVNGLAYTSYGGSTLQIEVNIIPGKGKLKLTGLLKEVMQESAMISLSYVRSNAKKFGIEDFNFDENTLHIHVPEGATPKDGPSAGVTFTTAILSAIKNQPISSEYAMTGEVTLRGRVLEIGGLREKSFAAYQQKIKYVFIPENNERNLQKIPAEIKEKIIYIPVENYDDIYDVLFLNKKPKRTIITKVD